jgi:hypothetical protein
METEYTIIFFLLMVSAWIITCINKGDAENLKSKQ